MKSNPLSLIIFLLAALAFALLAGYAGQPSADSDAATIARAQAAQAEAAQAQASAEVARANAAAQAAQAQADAMQAQANAVAAQAQASAEIARAQTDAIIAQAQMGVWSQIITTISCLAILLATAWVLRRSRQPTPAIVVHQLPPLQKRPSLPAPKQEPADVIFIAQSGQVHAGRDR
jgi:hypothetical protein